MRDIFYCHLTQVPLRAEPSSTSEMVTQLIFGEGFFIVQDLGDWLQIETTFDSYQGWISKTSIDPTFQFQELGIQHTLLERQYFKGITYFTSMGSAIIDSTVLVTNAPDIFQISKKFLNTPYLWGGRTFAGIDCSGFTQIVFKTQKIALPRDASQQQKMGKPINFLHLSAGDLVFFEKNNKVAHVGLSLGNGEIIHAHGFVRIDELSSQGILNKNTGILTHQFHSIKRIVS